MMYIYGDMGYHLLFFLLLPGGPGMKGLLSPPAACCMSAGAPPPGIFPMVASVTIVAHSLMPLIISVLMPLEVPTVTGCCGECVSFTRPEFVGAFAVFHDVVFADKRSFGGEAEGACPGTESTSLRSSV